MLLKVLYRLWPWGHTSDSLTLDLADSFEGVLKSMFQAGDQRPVGQGEIGTRRH